MVETRVEQLQANAHQQAPEAGRRHGPESDPVSGGIIPCHHLDIDFVQQEGWDNFVLLRATISVSGHLFQQL